MTMDHSFIILSFTIFLDWRNQFKSFARIEIFFICLRKSPMSYFNSAKIVCLISEACVSNRCVYLCIYHITSMALETRCVRFLYSIFLIKPSNRLVSMYAPSPWISGTQWAVYAWALCFIREGDIFSARSSPITRTADISIPIMSRAICTRSNTHNIQI